MRLLFILILSFLLAPTPACIHYSGSMPFDNDAPFTATIIEKDVTLCWFHTTYNEHNILQTLKNIYPSPEEKIKEEKGEGDYNTWGFRRWEMLCLEGYKGWIGVRLRVVGFRDETENGKNPRALGWITDVKEDAWGNRWVFGKDAGCEKEKEKGKEKSGVGEKGQEVGMKALSERERKRDEAQRMIRAGVREKAGEKKLIT
jgi:hypothetical protein